jgi:hypothetical protein
MACIGTASGGRAVMLASVTIRWPTVVVVVVVVVVAVAVAVAEEVMVEEAASAVWAA